MKWKSFFYLNLLPILSLGSMKVVSLLIERARITFEGTLSVYVFNFLSHFLIGALLIYVIINVKKSSKNGWIIGSLLFWIAFPFVFYGLILSGSYFLLLQLFGIENNILFMISGVYVIVLWDKVKTVKKN